jgi:serine protease AprX
VMFNMSWPYMPPEDGFFAWTGIAPDSKLVGVKVLDSSGSGNSTGLIDGLDWVIANRVSLHITVASMSLEFDGEVSSVDVATVNLVNSGVSTIVAAGNDGSGVNNIYTPGSVDEVLTVAAMNQFDGIASYSSQGGTSRYTGATVKPDVTAPGGSFYAVPLFSVDTNYNDAEGRWSDAVANDAAPMQGTSMAAPVVAGATQVLVEALGGFSGWNWTRSQALLPKMLLLMTATETYPNARESGTSPTLERGGKDAQEGYGRVNVDASADAVLKSYLTGTTIVDSLGLPPKPGDISVLGQRLCWARNVQLLSGIAYNFTLAVPAGADFDLYLYDATGNAFGEPVVLTKGTSAALGGDESIVYTPASSGEYFVVVKRAQEDTGGGQFILASTPRQTAHLLLSVEPNQPAYMRGSL